MKNSIKQISLLLTVLGFVVLQSCNKEEVCFKEPNPVDLNAELAMSNVRDFLSHFETETRTLSNSREVCSVEPFVRSNNENVNITRNAIPNVDDTLFYVVSFADNQGFALATPRQDGTGVLAFVENGNFYEAIKSDSNNGFSFFMNLLMESKSLECGSPETNLVKDDFIVDDYSGSIGNGSSTPADKFEIMKPLLKTSWCQKDPYNFYCPNHYPAGCVMIAVSQICTFLERPNYIFNEMNETVDFDWKKINEESLLDKTYNRQGKDYSAEVRRQIASLVRFWGVAFDADYNSDETSANTEDAVNLMRNRYGYNVTKMTDYNIDNVINDLKSKNKILIMQGADHWRHTWLVFKKYYGGHAWVVDGYIDKVECGVRSKYIHCNWGWDNGQYNGYFLSSALDAANDMQYDDNGNRRTYQSGNSGKNYRYLLKTATFTK